MKGGQTRRPNAAVGLAGAWGAVVLLHLLLWELLTHRPAQLLAPKVPLRVTLRLLPSLVARVPDEPGAAPLRQTTGSRAAQRRALVPARAEGPLPDAAPPAPAPGPQPITVPAEPPEAAASQPPLDLRWRAPAGRAPAEARSPAMADPRANSARATLSERMARTLGSDTRLTEEARADGTLRLRQGSACVDLKTTRASQLFPFDQSTRPSPRLAEACD